MEESTNRIAFVKDGVIEQILITDVDMADLILGDSLKVDITPFPNGVDAKPGDTYNIEDNTIILASYEEPIPPYTD